MRKKIDKKNCVDVGYVKKTHGIKGDLSIVFNDDLIDDIDHLDFLFFDIDGLLVPFFVENPSGALRSNLKFRNVDSKEKASQYIGCKVFIDRSEINPETDSMTPSMLKGFKIIDQNHGVIGEVIEVNDFGGNLVLTVNYQNNEIMIPFNEDLVVSLNMEEATLEMDFPEGLLDLSE